MIFLQRTCLIATNHTACLSSHHGHELKRCPLSDSSVTDTLPVLLYNSPRGLAILRLQTVSYFVGWHATERQCRERLEVRVPLLFAPLIICVAIIFPLARFARSYSLKFYLQWVDLKVCKIYDLFLSHS